MLSGSLSATPSTSTFTLLGNEFEILRGTLTLDPREGTTPFIDLEAQTRVENVDITAAIRGRVSRPEIRMTSTPNFSEGEIFAMLVSGSAGTFGRDDQEHAAAQAASALAAFSSPVLQQEVGTALGVDRVSVSFGESVDEPIDSVGKQLQSKLYGEASYHANAPSDQNRTEFMLRYRFLPQWTYETFFGDQAASGMGIWWSKMFD